jgi:23S rRNA (pseudouridine1915-N3)-methyltransferase
MSISNKPGGDKHHHVWNVAAGKSPWRVILGLSRHGCRYKPTAVHGIHDGTHLGKCITGKCPRASPAFPGGFIMMTINIIAIGKIKEKYLTTGISEYTKRLSKYCKLNIIELNDEKIPENASEKQEELVRIKEGQQILNQIKEGTYAIALCIEGKQPDSIELAGTIENLALTGKSNITFIIGGSVGLSQEVKNRADLHLSFSKLTFPHQLMRLILLEQIYRAFKILNNEP